MAFKPIKVNGRALHVQKCIVEPDFGTRTILVDDKWDYVEMWLKRAGVRKRNSQALLFWRQAHAFYEASKVLPKTSSPLTSYYSALNATKALLTFKGRAVSGQHGIDGESIANKTSLTGETVRLLTGGVLPELCRYLGEPVAVQEYALKDVLFNLPYLHRAYTVTFRSSPELFIPIREPLFVRKEGSSEAWFCCELAQPGHINQNTINTLAGFERDAGVQDRCVVRMTNRFRWERGVKQADNIARLKTYHSRVRKSAFYIFGLSRLWYLKRGGAVKGLIPRHSLTLTFMALHRLSELARYTPDRLARHFECQHNWLLSEFINLSLPQFIDEISSEITGNDFMPPGYTVR